MIPQAHITAWRSTAPWADDAQVEQDLVLSRAVVEVFTDPGLAGSLTLRGGTAFNKLFIHPPSRYSEDIDLVQAEPGAIGDVLNAIRSLLDPWLGRPKRSSSEASVTLVYRFDSEIAPVRPLRLKIEINTREHFAVMGHHRKELSVTNPWFTGEAAVTTYKLNELMGTKLRALYQRRKGRDLFDLWLCLSHGMLEPDQVVECFDAYMKHEKRTISRAEFERNLFEKEDDRAFLDDIRPLLTAGIDYNAKVAATLVREKLLSRLAGEPWRGAPSGGDVRKRRGRRPGTGRKH
ncbi:MAG: nucleotidyl transferase AbiEii/AbiGii toxin family protein [Phycisphaerae bacterium]|nr:nucleotidyl transferase AbiEii/AbiGii toxin family protein [Phycisphaerae bacterium]